MNIEAAEKMLDVAAVGAMLRSSPLLGGRGVASVVLESTWIKPTRYFNAHYSVQMLDGGTLAPSLFLLDRKRVRHIVAGADSATTTALMPEILLQVFPLDYRLPTLPRCLDVAHVRQFVPTLELTSCEVKAYRPGIRCQLRYETAGGTAVYGKVAVESRGVGYLFQTQARLRAALTERGSALRLPLPRAYAVELGLTFLDEVAGTSLPPPR
jgi:hypothetical protein